MKTEQEIELTGDAAEPYKLTLASTPEEIEAARDLARVENCDFVLISGVESISLTRNTVVAGNGVVSVALNGCWLRAFPEPSCGCIDEDACTCPRAGWDAIHTISLTDVRLAADACISYSPDPTARAAAKRVRDVIGSTAHAMVNSEDDANAPPPYRLKP